MQINAIIDVGVNAQTIELIKAFPSIHHHLYEIDPIHDSSIRSNYAELKYTLNNLGLSDVSGEMFINSFSIHGNDKITHTVIRDRPLINYNGNQVLSSKKVQLKRLDQLDQVFPPNLLMKIDVDGTDLNVFSGAEGILELIDVVVIESTNVKLADTINKISRYNYFLSDIADIMYYGDSIYQMDLIFIRNKYKSIFLEDLYPFKPQEWKTYDSKNFIKS